MKPDKSYSLYQEKEITKELYHNIMTSIKVQYKMDTTFMNSANHKTLILIDHYLIFQIKSMKH